MKWSMYEVTERVGVISVTHRYGVLRGVHKPGGRPGWHYAVLAAALLEIGGTVAALTGLVIYGIARNHGWL